MKKGPRVKKYRVFTSEFKKQVVDEVEGGKSLSQAAREHQLSPGLITQWRSKHRNGEDFRDRPTATEKAQAKELERYKLKVAELTLENDLLKKLQEELSRRTKRSSGLLVIGKPLVRKDGPAK